MADNLSIINAMIGLRLSSRELELMYPSAESRKQIDLSYLKYANKDMQSQRASPTKKATSESSPTKHRLTERKTIDASNKFKTS